jgi:hypothetical protein
VARKGRDLVVAPPRPRLSYFGRGAQMRQWQAGGLLEAIEHDRRVDAYRIATLQRHYNLELRTDDPLVSRRARIVAARLDTSRPSPCPPASGRTALFPPRPQGLYSTSGAFSVSPLTPHLVGQRVAPDEMRALRRLKRESSASPFIFARMIERTAAAAGLELKAHPHMLRHACGYALADRGHDTRAIQGWLGPLNHEHRGLYGLGLEAAYGRSPPMANAVSRMGRSP